MSSNKILNQYLQIHNLSIEDFQNLRDFTNYNHQSFEDAADSIKFVETLCEHRNTRQVIIDTDYDCDGVMSGVILEASLRRFGFNVSTYHPTEHDGYGLTLSEAKRILKKFPDVSLIVTADSGINCKEAIDFLDTKDVKVLVSDHHPGTLENYPDKALVCVDVNRIDKKDHYEFKHISGAQTAHKLMMMYAERYASLADVLYVSSLKLFAAISVLSDVMLIEGENRELVKELLDTFNCSKIDRMSMTNEYIYRLQDFVNRFGGQRVTLETFGFAVIPTINSNRRMLGESNLAFEVFSDNAAVREKAINSLMRLNDLRKTVKKSARENEKIVAKSKYLTIGLVDVQQGILGLVASDYANRGQCAALAFRMSKDDRMTASGRGYAGYSIKALLEKVKEKEPNLDLAFGGHSHALGCSVAIDDFKRFCKIMEETSLEIFNDEMNTPEVTIDLPLASLIRDFRCQDEIKEVCQILEDFQPMPNYLDNLKIRITDKKKNFSTVGFESFGREYEHLKLDQPNLEILGFFDFTEFCHADNDETFSMTISLKVEKRQIKGIISKIMHIDGLQ